MRRRIGGWKAVCDVCGFEFNNTELQRRWDNLMVCREDYEERHPQDFLRPVKESIIPWSRPEAADVYIDAEELYVAQFYWDLDDGVYVL
jgi:hypothetical protein